MKSKFLSTILTSFLFAISCFSTVTHAGIIFSEDFENGLSFGAGENWNSNISAVIVEDPLQGDSALSFSQLIGGGDLKSNTITSATGKFFVSFNYLGACNSSDCGGFFWNTISSWVGTHPSYPDLLVDNGEWTTYMVELQGNSMSIHFEDWVGSGGVTGDAFFDNIVISDTSFEETLPVPEPSTLAIFALGIIGLVSSRFKKQS